MQAPKEIIQSWFWAWPWSAAGKQPFEKWSPFFKSSILCNCVCNSYLYKSVNVTYFSWSLVLYIFYYLFFAIRSLAGCTKKAYESLKKARRRHHFWAHGLSPKKYCFRQSKNICSKTLQLWIYLLMFVYILNFI